MVDFPSNIVMHNGTQHIIKSYYDDLCFIPYEITFHESPTYTVSHPIRLTNRQTTSNTT